MADATADQLRRYVLDGSDDDLRRLLSLSESFAEHARRSLRRVGVGPGWTVIDCGSGPIGGLAILAEMVGPAGRVVGVDFSEPAIQYARSVMAALGLANVALVAGDIHELDAATLDGPFDLAFTRAFLMHQADPVRTLGPDRGPRAPGRLDGRARAAEQPAAAIAASVRCPRALLGLGARSDGRAGVPRGTVERLPRAALEAGLDVVQADGFFATQEPELGFEIHAGTLAAARGHAVKAGIAAETIDDLVARLRAAKVGGYEWVTSPFLLDLVLRKPQSM